jgi:uncharacterized protein (DUF302 family)
MEYYFSKTINDSFENNRKLQQLLVEGFGVLTEIDLKTLKETGCRFYNYTILGAQSGFRLQSNYWQKIK